MLAVLVGFALRNLLVVPTDCSLQSSGESALFDQPLASGSTKRGLNRNIIITASHLKTGSFGEQRLKIISHNLQMLMDSKANPKPRSVLVVSHEGSRQDMRKRLKRWQLGPGKGLVTDILFVENDAIKVDCSKWIVPLRELEADMRSGKSDRIVLLNDSFLLVRPVPELFDDKQHNDVLGLVWSSNEPDRHIQSYIRSLSSEGTLSYMSYYDKNAGSVTSVHDFIVKFEVNADWSPSPVEAIFEAPKAGHPDNDASQKELIAKGYPAIKLKKFHVPDDPWLSEPDGIRARLPPSFSADAYRKANHDLNHMTDEELENHFANFGKNEDRVYSNLPRTIKPWLRAELTKAGATSSLALLEDYVKDL